MKILAFVGEGLGNCVMMTPAIQAVQQMYPYVVVDVMSKFPGVFYNMPFVNPIRGQKYAHKHYEVSIANIFDYPQFYSNINVDDPWPRPQYSLDHHEVKQNLLPIIEKGFTSEWPMQYVPYIERDPLFPSDRPVVAVCDGSKPRSDCQSDMEYQVWGKKRWPHFKEFCANLLGEGAIVVIIGTKEDGPYIGSDPRFDTTRFYDMRGMYKIEELAGVLAQCDAFVANDCGPMHVGDAIGVKTYALFGPTSITKNAPATTSSVVIDAREVTGIMDEPVQGMPEFSQWTHSPSLEALTPEQVRAIMGDLK